MLQSLLFVEGVIPAMFGLGVVDAAIIFLFLRIFSQPGAPGHPFAGNGTNPDVIPALLARVVKNIHPLQNIFPALGPPSGYILWIGGSEKSIQIEAASPALFALESLRWGHVESLLSWATANSPLSPPPAR
jgi:hypothetical protein